MKRRQALVFAAILTLCVGCDHATKQLAATALADGPTVSVAADTLRLELVRNPGGFLSLGAHLPAWLRDLLFVSALPLFLIIIASASSPRDPDSQFGHSWLWE